VCTWPSEAPAIGIGSKRENALEMRTPSSLSTIFSTSSYGNGLHAVLQARQGLQVRLGQQVRAAGEHLAQLHERGSHALEVVRQLLRIDFAIAVGRRSFLVVVQVLVELHLLDEIGASVFPDELEDFLVALQVLGIDFHGCARAPLGVVS
jgi:hypothetical protein